MHKCEYCKAELSAGDISVIPKGNEITYEVICHGCDKCQENIKVVESNGIFLVFDKRGTE